MYFLFKELKNRLILILIGYLYCFIICYFYKDTLYFILITSLILKKNLNFYFIYTNVTEIFAVYVTLIQFISLCVVTYYIIYHIFNFFSTAFFRVEFFMIKKAIYSIIFVFIIVFLLHHFLFFPLVFGFFLNFHQLFSLSSLFFEIKMAEYIAFYLKMYNLTFLSLFTVNTGFFILKQFTLKLKLLVKIRKIIYFILVFSFTFFVVDNLIQLLTILTFILLFELNFFLKVIKTHLKIS